MAIDPRGLVVVLRASVRVCAVKAEARRRAREVVGEGEERRSFSFARGKRRSPVVLEGSEERRDGSST